MTELSPDAQAVLDAALSVPIPGDNVFGIIHLEIAAAIEALADQVASPIPGDCSADVFNRQLKIRTEILAIAAELRGTPAP